MKKFLLKLWAGIVDLYDKLVGNTKKVVPIAINIVQAIKKVMDSPVDDVILEIIRLSIPGDADDKMIAKVKDLVEKWLPEILLRLKLVESIADIEDKNEQLRAILEQLKLSPDAVQNVYYHGLASLILEKLSDGKIQWADAVAISEYAYQHLIVKKEIEL